VPGAREAIVAGFNWIFGANEMGRSMLVPELRLIYRSMARCGFRGSREARLARAVFGTLVAGENWPAQRPAVRLTREMRSYEFGWLLWSFAGRTDYPELTERDEFRIAAQ
jgi:hypothetical protein